MFALTSKFPAWMMLTSPPLHLPLEQVAAIGPLQGENRGETDQPKQQ